MKSIWMNAWDLEDVQSEELIAFLKDCGLNACNLAFSYHGGRMLLPRNRRHKVYEQEQSALYFPATRARYENLRLQPRVAPQAELVERFVKACVRAKFEVNAWTVLCHNDWLGMQSPECCIENAFGDKYTYALCPSNPDVRRYVTTLCTDIAAYPGVASLDLEALSFMGIEHQGLHDKRGIPLSPATAWLLSLCFCADCRSHPGTSADEIAMSVRTSIEDYFEELPEEKSDADLYATLEEMLGTDILTLLLEMRRQTLKSLLEEVRAATGNAHLNLRVATSPLFYGGKTALSWDDIAAYVDSATVTFIGATKERMHIELDSLPPPDARLLPVYGGFSFHHPDCKSEVDVCERATMIRTTQLDGSLFYLYGMAADKHFAWLKTALRES